MTSEPLNQYTDICKDAIKGSSAKLGKTFENLLLEILLLTLCLIDRSGKCICYPLV